MPGEDTPHQLDQLLGRGVDVLDAESSRYPTSNAPNTARYYSRSLTIRRTAADPVDARCQRGQARRRDGDLVTVTSSGGQIEVPVEVTGAIMPRVVSMPYSWGHGKSGTRMAITNDSPGANTNILSPPTFIDEPLGNGALNGIPVTVTAMRPN